MNLNSNLLKLNSKLLYSTTDPMTASSSPTTFNPSLERLKCAGKVTGVTAKWVVLWPAIGVYEFARSCHSWRVNDRVSRDTTTFHPQGRKDVNDEAINKKQSNEKEQQVSLPQDGAERFFKGLGLTVWFLRHWIFVAPRYMVEECRAVHMEHKEKMYHREKLYEELPAMA